MEALVFMLNLNISTTAKTVIVSHAILVFLAFNRHAQFYSLLNYGEKAAGKLQNKPVKSNQGFNLAARQLLSYSSSLALKNSSYSP